MLIFQVLELIYEASRRIKRHFYPIEYKAVIFDLDQVFLRVDEKDDLVDLMKLVSRDQYLSRIYLDYELGKMSFSAFFDCLKVYFPGKTKHLSWQEVRQKTLGQKDPKIANLIEKLREHNLKIGLLTNIGFGTDAKDVTDTPTEVNDVFDVVVESCREGVRKPNHRTYEITAFRLGVFPHECIYIDDLMRNCRGAELVGMKSFHLGNGNVLRLLDDLQTFLGVPLL
ncbi:unnamed protein product [Bursaphelenchus xylophilus]|uniref:(pine wood nematode) hypothetical protein n=1 Tax=Bursaphelenchus xylophilus TaxID=6326 RepID=A0A1I7RYR0_BURXY|nr:unnamed protein product [Bursaphelenchus xylophilus]CAG9092365.1 unnamed protein product [Bursaphelenchus xylophilus]